MYKHGESMNLSYLKNKLQFNPKTILDIGAHRGQFYTWAKKEETQIELHETSDWAKKLWESYDNVI